MIRLFKMHGQCINACRHGSRAAECDLSDIDHGMSHLNGVGKNTNTKNHSVKSISVSEHTLLMRPDEREWIDLLRKGIVT